MSDLAPATILRKTESGVLAIKERDRSLAPRARTLLIMVDGVRTAGQLAAVNVDVPQGMVLLKQLVDSGFVSAPDTAARAGESLSTAPVPASPASLSPTRPMAAPVPAAAPAQASPLDLTASIRRATRFLEGMMGPGADTFNIQLERCKNVPEFEAKVQEITLLLARARSVKKAEEFNAVALGK